MQSLWYYIYDSNIVILPTVRFSISGPFQMVTEYQDNALEMIGLRTKTLITQTDICLWLVFHRYPSYRMFQKISRHLKSTLYVAFSFYFPRHVWIPQALFQSQAHSDHHGGRCECREWSTNLQGRKWEVEEVAIAGNFLKSKTHTQACTWQYYLFLVFFI